MHRTILNMLQSLLFQSFLPSQFWVEALNTAVHLLNILTSSKLKFKTPYELLFGKQPSYHHLRVFGCSCFPNLDDYLPHKLSPRSKHCIFLGYPANYKGFKCLNPLENKVMLFFQEDSFPYPSFSSTCISPNTSLSSSKSPSSLLFPSLTSPHSSPTLSPNRVFNSQTSPNLEHLSPLPTHSSSFSPPPKHPSSTYPNNVA